MRLVRSLAAAACGAVLVIACSSSTDASGHGIAEGCNINSDCNTPLVCAFQRCHNQCSATRDCPSTQRCIESDRPYSVCQLPEERSCVSNATCPIGQVCARDAQCRNGCSTDRDCITGQVCAGGACAEPSELVDGGLPSAGDAGASGVPCVLNSDCADGLFCKNAVCTVECRAQVDCRSDETCSAGRCVGGAPPLDGGADAPDGFGNACVHPSDCTPPLVCTSGRCVYECNTAIDCPGAGTCCFKHQCALGAVCTQMPDGGTSDACRSCSSNDQCDDQLFCNGPERCFAGCCAAALDTPCDSHSACIKDVCTEATKACSHMAQAGQDVDGDGHLAFGCVGGDDCDDNDATVFTGAREICDNKDNDCNGLIDDRSRTPYGAPLVSAASPNYGFGAAATAGSLTAVFLGTRVNVTPELDGQVFDANRVATGGSHAILTSPPGTNGIIVQDSDGEPGGTAAVAFSGQVGGAQSTQLLVFYSVASNNVLAELQRVTLVPMGPVIPGTDVDLIWTGSAFVVGWAGPFGGTQDGGGPAAVGTFAQYRSDGTISVGSQTVPTPDASGRVLGRVRVTFSASGLGVAYQLPDRTLVVATYGSGGSFLAKGTVAAALPAKTPLVHAVGGTAGGYIVAWSDVDGLHATFVATNGAVGATVFVSSNAPLDGDGSTDGAGAAFAFRYPNSAVFGYARGDLSTSPFELSTAYTPAVSNAGDVVKISGANNKLAVSYFASAVSASMLAVVSAGCH